MTRSLDGRVVEIALQRPESGHRVQHGANDRLRIAERGQWPAEAAFVVGRDHVVDDAPHRRRIGDRIESLPANDVTDLGIDDLESGHAADPVDGYFVHLADGTVTRPVTGGNGT